MQIESPPDRVWFEEVVRLSQHLVKLMTAAVGEGDGGERRIDSTHPDRYSAGVVSMWSVQMLPWTFTTKVARGLGVHPRDLYAWRDSGEIVEVSRGVFRRGDAPPASYPDALAVSHRVPRGIVCCLSAAVVHDLTDELVGAVQIAVPKGGHVPTIDYPPTTVFQFDGEAFELGLSEFEAAPGEWVRVYDAARTVVDLMRLRHRFGEPIAHAALNRFLAMPGARATLLLDYSRAVGAFGPMRAAVDIASAL